MISLERTAAMKFIVRIFAGGTLIEPSEYDRVVITCKTTDRIVNRVYALANEQNDATAEDGSA